MLYVEPPAAVPLNGELGAARSVGALPSLWEPLPHFGSAPDCRYILLAPQGQTYPMSP